MAQRLTSLIMENVPRENPVSVIRSKRNRPWMIKVRSNASKRAWATRKLQARLRARDMAEERAEVVKTVEPAGA